MTRLRAATTIQVMAANDATVVAERTFEGPSPQACPDEVTGIHLEWRGDEPALGTEAVEWIEGYVNGRLRSPTASGGRTVPIRPPRRAARNRRAAPVDRC